MRFYVLKQWNHIEIKGVKGKYPKMIRSSKSSIRYANAHRRSALESFMDEYHLLLQRAVGHLWSMDKVPSLLPKDMTTAIAEGSSASARLAQCIGKQASGIVRGTRKKTEKRIFMEAKLRKEGQSAKADKLRKIIDETKFSVPNLVSAEAELDSRFIDIDWQSDTDFIWVRIASIGAKRNIEIPVKRTKHMERLRAEGTPLSGVRISRSAITFMFELPEPALRAEGTTIGIDIGVKKVWSSSDGRFAPKCPHGHSLETIIEKISKKRRGSAAFRRASEHRKNHINWSINRLNLKGVAELRLEDIKHLRKGVRTSRRMAAWTYTDIAAKLEDKCARLGVRVERVAPAFTSQRCPQCGFVHKGNRKLELFKCKACGHEADADTNGAVNISLTLPAVPKGFIAAKRNRTGFFWPNHQPIVGDGQKWIS